MTPKTRKRLLMAGGVLALLLLVTGGIAAWVLATESGARWAFERIGGLLEGSLEARSLRGPIRGPLVVEGLVYETSELTVTVERLELRWRLRQLLRKRLDVTRLAAHGVRVTSTPKETEERREALPDVHLPVNVIVREAEVTDIVVGPESPEPLTIDRIALATRAIGDEVRIERLLVRSPRLNADVSGTVRPQGDYPLDLDLSWSAALRGERWAGRGSFDGSLERVLVRHELSAPVSARLSGTLTKPLRDLRFDARIEARDLLLTKLDPSAPPVTISGAVQARGAVETFTASGSLAALWPEGPVEAAGAAFRVARARDSWKVERLELTAPGSPMHLRATGEVVLGTPARLDLAAQWRQLAWPLRGEALIESPTGSMRIEGTLEKYRLRGEARLASARIALGRLEIAGVGSSETLSIARLDAEALGGKITAAGSFAWKPQIAWQVRLAAAGLQPEQFAREWPGELALRASTRGRITPEGPVGRVEVTEIAGGLRGYRVSGEATAEMRGELWDVQGLELAVGSARLQGSGTLGRLVNARAFLSAPEFSDLMPGWGGSLQLRVSATGPRRAPRVEVAMEASRLDMAGWSAESLTGNSMLDLASNGPLRLSLKASGIAGGGRAINTAEVEATGRRNAHRIRAQVDGEELDLALALEGGLAEATWSGALTALALDSRDAGRWRLAAPAKLSIGSAGGRLDGFCWRGERGRLCADAEWGERLALDASVANLPLELAEPWLPGSVDLAGELNGEIEAARGPEGRLTATAGLEAGPGEIRYETADGNPVARGFERASLAAKAGEGGAAAELAFHLTGGGSLEGRVELPRYGERGREMKAQPLQGRLSADLPDIGWAQALLPQVDRLAGTVRADLRLSGSLGSPAVAGEAVLTEGRARLGRFGITLSEIALAARGEGDGPLSVTGSARSGDGRLEIRGQLPLAPGASRPLRLTLRGRRFEMMDTAQARVLVTPDLEAVVTDRVATVTGEVSVPEAEIRYRRSFAPISASPDVVFVGGRPGEPEGTSATAGREISARVRVSLGDKVIFRGMGLEARLEGSLLVTQRPGAEPAATGELRLEEGTFTKYGQDLTIERGRILFAGPIDEPYVDLRAYRRADDGTVAGIELTGPLERPRTSLFSDPPMSETDQLAYILLGHPMGQASEAEGDLVTGAATSLGFSGGNLLARRLGSEIGLDVTRLETEGSLEEAALVLGKYLTPRLYVEYGVGLFDALSTLRVEYLLSKKWTLRAETGEGTSADILYTIEH